MMHNKKSIIYVGCCLAIIFLMFNVIVFSTNRSFATNFWSGYLFTIGAYILTCIICIAPIGIKTKKNNGVFYSIPLVLFSMLYLLLQLLVGSCVIYIKNFNIGVSLVLQILLLLLYLFFVVIQLFYRNHVEQNSYGVKAKRFFKNEVEIKVLSLTVPADGKSKTALEKLKEQVKYEIENLSTEQVSEIENKIIVKLDELEENITKEKEENIVQLCEEIGQLLKQRNVLCKNRM